MGQSSISFVSITHPTPNSWKNSILLSVNEESRAVFSYPKSIGEDPFKSHLLPPSSCNQFLHNKFHVFGLAVELDPFDLAFVGAIGTKLSLHIRKNNLFVSWVSNKLKNKQIRAYGIVLQRKERFECLRSCLYATKNNLSRACED